MEAFFKIVWDVFADFFMFLRIAWLTLSYLIKPRFYLIPHATNYIVLIPFDMNFIVSMPCDMKCKLNNLNTIIRTKNEINKL